MLLSGRGKGGRPEAATRRFVQGTARFVQNLRIMSSWSPNWQTRVSASLARPVLRAVLSARPWETAPRIVRILAGECGREARSRAKPSSAE